MRPRGIIAPGLSGPVQSGHATANELLEVAVDVD